MAGKFVGQNEYTIATVSATNKGWTLRTTNGHHLRKGDLAISLEADATGKIQTAILMNTATGALLGTVTDGERDSLKKVQRWISRKS